MKYFEYSQKELECLKKKDKRLAQEIEAIGIIKREMSSDLFSGIVESIISQQISIKAANTVLNRLLARIQLITPTNISSLSNEDLQSIGISFRKANYIKNIASSVLDGSFNMEELNSLSDQEVIERLDRLNGIGVWTAEMLMIFAMGRQDILSYDDLAIRRGIMKLYHHKTLDQERFLKYKKRYSPYGSIASLYLWDISLRK